jgi:hypothetical protein
MYNHKKQRKIEIDATQHYPNNKETKMLRKLMAENKLTEEEVRNNKKYRKLLSEASFKRGDKTSKDRLFLFILKKITKELKLPKSHPDVLNKLDIELKSINFYNFWDTNHYKCKYIK